MTLLSWNINGIRAISDKGFLDTLHRLNPDILALQETKAEAEQVPDPVRNPSPYEAHWNACQTRRGYSGTALISKPKPLSVSMGWGEPCFDNEGRTIVADYGAFVFLGIYYPNGESSPERLQYKLDFYDSFLKYVCKLRKEGRSVVFCGDVNTAHNEIDLARPKENKNTSGFLRIERDWLDRFVEAGFVDTFRAIHPGKADMYSWWSYRSGARLKNIGWRIDYFFISDDLLPKLKDAFILGDVTGSDHCPVGIVLDV